MFSFFQSERSKLKDAAKNWLYLGSKVYNFRRDLLSESEVSELARLMEGLRSEMKGGDVNKLEYSVNAMESHMRVVGGTYYPRSSWGENIEFFFVAFIIYLGFTSFFIKPFKIPTNSMWPTYHGMTGEVWESDEDAPGVVSRVFRKVAYWASRYEVEAPVDGELLIPLRRTGLVQQTVQGKRFGILPSALFPTLKDEFFLMVGNETVKLSLPQTFNLGEQVLRERLFPEAVGFREGLEEALRRKGTVVKTMNIVLEGVPRQIKVEAYRTGLKFKKGETALSFDVLTGDQLFVDRMSYHFVEPKVGDGFVFRTENITRNSDKDKFYIKRLVGTPGDTVQIKDGGLLVNGEPAEGSVAFELNATKTPPYRGYSNDGDFRNPERVIEVKENMYLPFGDNSNHSSDGRMWGQVPEMDVIGRPLVIYYPFTKRFGFTK